MMGYCYSIYIKNYDYSKYFSKTMEIFSQNNLNNLFINAFGNEHSGEVEYDYKDFQQKIDEILGGRFYFLQCKTINNKSYFEAIYLTLNIDFQFFEFSLTYGNCDKSMPIVVKFDEN